MRLTLNECSFEHPAFVSLDWVDMKVDRLGEQDNPPPAPRDSGVFLTLFVEDCPTDQDVKETKSFVSKGNRIFRRAKQINGQLPRGPKALLASPWGFVVDQVRPAAPDVLLFVFFCFVGSRALSHQCTRLAQDLAQKGPRRGFAAANRPRASRGHANAFVRCRLDMSTTALLSIRLEVLSHRSHVGGAWTSDCVAYDCRRHAGLLCALDVLQWLCAPKDVVD